MKKNSSRLTRLIITVVLLTGLVACDRGYQGNDNPTNPTPETTGETQ